ncbi:hypothetical protein ACN077_20670 [Clostridium chromiireducens]|uniref:hypothetical protein n=1 Tax=Clostridium chromiireducens TaxID=225345 RepID=UPI003AF938CC
MTATQKLLGNILKNRINTELAKPEDQRDFTTIEIDMDILLAGGKITADQYNDLKTLITTV